MIFIETLILVVFLFRKKLVLLADLRGLCFLEKVFFEWTLIKLRRRRPESEVSDCMFESSFLRTRPS